MYSPTRIYNVHVGIERYIRVRNREIHCTCTVYMFTSVQQGADYCQLQLVLYVHVHVCSTN